MIIAITGHRPDKLGNEWDGNGTISQKISDKLQELIEEHKPTLMISGMALGVDTIWAKLAIKNGIPLTAAVPFQGQESKWPNRAQVEYLKLIYYAQVEVICQGFYAAWKMQKRNEWMVDRCDLLIAVWDGSKGGTGNCVEYARKVNKKIIVIDPREL
jgi:uncharacterized phage-like protein YoqJ